MDNEIIIQKINHELIGIFGALVMPQILTEISEVIFKKIKPDLCPKDLVSYHDVVKIVESYRPISDGHPRVESTINKLRDALRKLKKS